MRSTPSTGGAERRDARARGLLERAGGSSMLARDLVDRLAGMPRLLQACAERLPRAEWTRQPSPGLFSLVEHCCHLRDLEEEGYTLRLRRMLREEGPVLDDFDGGAVAARRAYPGQDLALAVQAFTEARGRNLLLLAGLDAGALARTARFGEQGTITVARLAELMAEHDAGHRAELQDLFRTLGAPPPT